MEVYGDSTDDAQNNIKRSDKARASYYKHISGRKWGEAGNYELTVDSSIGVEECAKVIAEYISKREYERI